ncbi:hypothetical protein BJV78DRAFT_1150861 [Lactifluus subvellereus]|nr:hypothetical protein BJV78DRAFT_1150861 [Lactifluus subvellereus]
MVVSFFVTFSCLLLLIGPACAESFNSLGQNPCLIAAHLAAVCNNGVFAIPALLPQHSYTGPNGPDNGDVCKCNTVLYNLISACDACQGDSWTTYSAWSYNCTTQAPAGTFPEPIPAGTRVPNWAYLNPVPGDSWNISTALLAGDSPEVTGSASTIQTLTRASQTTVTPTSASSSPSSSKSSQNTGAIAGGVVGGAVGAAMVAGVVAWFVIRRRRARSAPSAAFVGSQGSDVAQTTEPYPLSIEIPQKLYDPSDPSTYPPHAPSSIIHTTVPTSPYRGSMSDLNQHSSYTGLPEV